MAMLSPRAGLSTRALLMTSLCKYQEWSWSVLKSHSTIQIKRMSHQRLPALCERLRRTSVMLVRPRYGSCFKTACRDTVSVVCWGATVSKDGVLADLFAAKRAGGEVNALLWT